MKFLKYFWLNAKIYVGFMVFVQLFLLAGSIWGKYSKKEIVAVESAVLLLFLVIFIGELITWNRTK